jgi:hypothetical protein
MRLSKSCMVPLVSQLHFRTRAEHSYQESPTCQLKTAVRPPSVMPLLQNGRATDLYSRSIESLHDNDGADQKEDVVLGRE